MTLEEALVALADHPHAWRYRQLCDDSTDIERRDAYRALVVRLATGAPLAPAPVRVDYAIPPPTLPCCGTSNL